MIDYNPKSWFKLIFAFHRSDTFRILWKEILYIGFFTLGITLLKITYFPQEHVLDNLIAVYSLIGFVISLLLVFRTNTAYDRWWEGRKKWGELLNNSRNLSVKIAAFGLHAEANDFFARMIVNFMAASRDQLRTGVELSKLQLTDEEFALLKDATHVPQTIQLLMYRKLQNLQKEQIISGDDRKILDVNLNSFLDCLGACERIKNTPIPFSYNLFIKKFIFIYVTTLPLAFVNQFGFYSALIATFVFYVLVSMEVLAEEIEDPFGEDDNDLPINAIVERIESNVMAILKK